MIRMRAPRSDASTHSPGRIDISATRSETRWASDGRVAFGRTHRLLFRLLLASSAPRYDSSRATQAVRLKPCDSSRATQAVRLKPARHSCTLRVLRPRAVRASMTGCDLWSGNLHGRHILLRPSFDGARLPWGGLEERQRGSRCHAKPRRASQA